MSLTIAKVAEMAEKFKTIHKTPGSIAHYKYVVSLLNDEINRAKSNHGKYYDPATVKITNEELFDTAKTLQGILGGARRRPRKRRATKKGGVRRVRTKKRVVKRKRGGVKKKRVVKKTRRTVKRKISKRSRKPRK